MVQIVFFSASEEMQSRCSGDPSPAVSSFSRCLNTSVKFPDVTCAATRTQMPSGHGKKRAPGFCWFRLKGNPHPKKRGTNNNYWVTRYGLPFAGGSQMLATCPNACKRKHKSPKMHVGVQAPAFFLPSKLIYVPSPGEIMSKHGWEK